MKHLSERRTEDAVLDLLHIQGWQISRPPKGQLVRANEYKSLSHLNEIFKGKSKTGKGDAYPDFLLIDADTKIPLLIIETKADEDDAERATTEASDNYGSACYNAGHPVIAVGVAGQEKSGLRIRVAKFFKGSWKPIHYDRKPISWIPTPEDTKLLLSQNACFDLAPIVPRLEVLAEKADMINRILREAHIKDEFRPAHVGAMMLALWQSKGLLRRDADYILSDINSACEDAFDKGGKHVLAESLHVDEANEELANKAWQILSILENLNVVTASFAHDYLGQLYEAFFRYTGGNTIGQYFTPRHITRFMADICEVNKNDLVIDPACGTGGFLISCIQRVRDTMKVKYEDVVKMVKDRLIGYESEPVTAALCVANMILRGDGKTGIRKEDCFTAKGYPFDKCDVALMNPPFPHKKTDRPPQEFVERALEALTNRGKLAVILPTSLLVKKSNGPWREKLLAKHSLLAACQLPDELFQPYASSTTSVVLLEKGVPHSSARKTSFVRIQYDGLTLKKGVRTPRDDKKNNIPDAVDHLLNKKETPGFAGLGQVRSRREWGPGAYIPASIPSNDELKASIDELLRRLASFYVRYAAEVTRLRECITAEELKQSDYRSIISKKRLKNARSLSSNPNTIGEHFEIYYGQKELHSRDGVPPGDALVVSPTEEYNGCYGWLSFKQLIKPPFVTVAQTGSIGEAFVQMEPCGVNDDCLILLPRLGLELPRSCFFIAASIVRLERWRFSYGRKLTPSRICSFKMQRMPELESWVDSQLAHWEKVIYTSLDGYKAVTGGLFLFGT